MALEPILASCVADNGYYYGVGKKSIGVITSKEGFSSTFLALFAEDINLTDSPKIKAGPNNSAELEDPNIKDPKAGVYVIIQFYMKGDVLWTKTLPGDKIVSSVK